VAIRADDDRLDQAALSERLRQFGQGILIEVTARLTRMGLNAGNRQRLNATAALDWRFLDRLPQKRGEASTKTGGPLAQGLAHAAAAGLGKRSIISRASAI
jgi:hypothetical protein